VPFIGDQALQRFYADLIQARERPVAEPLLEHHPRRSNDPVHPPGRLDPLSSAVHQYGLA
jgi:hypothetical protein